MIEMVLDRFISFMIEMVLDRFISFMIDMVLDRFISFMIEIEMTLVFVIDLITGAVEALCTQIPKIIQPETGAYFPKGHTHDPCSLNPYTFLDLTLK